jgi:hypothetical protein
MKAVHLDPGDRARWLDSRIKTLEESLLAERWVSAEEATSAAAVARTLDSLRRTSGVLELRAGIRILTGWLAGPPAALVAAIAACDGVAVDLAAISAARAACSTAARSPTAGARSMRTSPSASAPIHRSTAARCRLRDAADVEARTVYWALRARAAETLQSSVQ